MVVRWSGAGAPGTSFGTSGGSSTGNESDGSSIGSSFGDSTPSSASSLPDDDDDNDDEEEDADEDQDGGEDQQTERQQKKEHTAAAAKSDDAKEEEETLVVVDNDVIHSIFEDADFKEQADADANDDSGNDNDDEEQQQNNRPPLPTTTASTAKATLPPRPFAGPPTITKSSSSPPTFGIESFYKHLSAHPQQWRLLYHTTNSPPVRLLTDVGLKLATERSVTAKIRNISPDVVISVHPLMNSIPSLSCAKISAESGQHLPFFTVVTDLGSGHDAWFAGRRSVERIFLASDAITELAMRRGKIPREKIVRSGLPIRHEFALHARGMGGDRASEQGARYRMRIREDTLELCSDPEHRVVLVMGGGEGCGALSSIVDSLYVELCSRSVDATVVVVCGRNETLKEALETRDWEGLRRRGHKRAERRRKTVVLAQRVRRMLSTISSTGDLRGAADAAAAASAVRFEDDAAPNEEGNADEGGTESPESTVGAVEEKDDNAEANDEVAAPDRTEFCTESRDEDDSGSDGEKYDETTPASPTADCLSPCSSMESLAAGSASVQVKPLGFVTNMAEYMVGADLLISKAGPGTIAEAAALGLPVLLTSYLPGQEEGNVDFVIKNGFGAYVADSDPDGVARQCSSWLRDEEGLAEQSKKAMEAGVPNAAEDIARYIGQSVVRWMHHHEESS